jgi:hypothetical protein
LSLNKQKMPDHGSEPSDLRHLINLYLRAYDHLEHEIELRIGAIAAKFGRGELMINGHNLDHCLRFFQRECLKYWNAFGIDEPSHLKVFGHLLYSLTQLRDEKTGDRLVFCAVADPGGEKTRETLVEADFFRVHFHEVACFNTVYEMLLSAQLRRKEPLRFDPKAPPANKRFTRSMVDYIRQWDTGPLKGDRSPFDFYMVFKAMDLYGVDTQY